MEKEICFICEKAQNSKNLSSFIDDDLALNDKIQETFRIKFDGSQNLEICKGKM
jgi:hypothetical protein